MTSTPALVETRALAGGPEQDLGPVRERLRIISKKHRMRPKSVDALADVIASIATSALSTAPPSALSALTPLATANPDQTRDEHSHWNLAPSMPHLDIAKEVLNAIERFGGDGEPQKQFEGDQHISLAPSPSCQCALFFPATASITDLALCASCNAPIPQLRALQANYLASLNSLVITLAQVESAVQNDTLQAMEAAQLLAKVEDLSVLIDGLAEECERHEADLGVLNEKCKDELSRIGDVERERDGLQQELDDLTKSLFEEANNMVQDETRQRQELEERERELESKLDETRNTLKREQVLLRELKIKMEDDYVPDVTEATESTSTSTSAAASKLKYPTDPNMYAEFQEFVSLAPSTKLAKMPNIPFLKNLIDDDILPTLRFGGNARTSTRKMLDAVAADLLTVQEMTPVQFSSWFSLNQTLKDALVVRSTHVSGGGTTTSNSVTTTVLAGKDVAVSPEASMPPPGVAATVSSYIPGLPRSRTPSEANVSPPVAAAPALNHEAQSAVSAVAAIAATASHSVFTKSIAERVSSWTLSESKAAADPLSNLPSFFVVSGCSTCGKICAIQHHFRINSSDGATVANTPTQPAAKKEEIEGWIPVCDNCFDRLDAVARFYAFVRVLRSGSFVGRSVEEMYAEVGAVKRDMFLSRIGGGGWNRRQGAQHQKGPAAGRAGRTASSSGLSFRQLGSVSRSSSEVLG